MVSLIDELVTRLQVDCLEDLHIVSTFTVVADKSFTPKTDILMGIYYSKDHSNQKRPGTETLDP